MTIRLLARMGLCGVLVAGAALVPLTVAAQQDEASFTARTPWGDPDLRGHWLPAVIQLMETPAGEHWRPPEGATQGHNAAFARFFEAEDPDQPRSERVRTPMVVDPPDGKIPLQPWAAEKRAEIVAKQDQLKYLDPRVQCLPSALPRANLPVGYNTYQILQVPGAVIVLYEWNHLYRYIPLDGRPHVGPDVRLGMGDSRGHWEGNTLVVEVTNFTENTWVVGHGAPPEGAPASALTSGHGVFHSDALRVVERFTRVDADSIHYEATIYDPKVFTRPWTISFKAFQRAPADHMLFEYACHEGNGRNIRLMTGVDIDAK